MELWWGALVCLVTYSSVVAPSSFVVRYFARLRRNRDATLRYEAGKPDYRRFMSVSVTGEPTLESDIAAFLRMKSENGEIKMELRTIGDGVEEYCICRDGENYVLSRVFLDPFTDDETGKTYQITRLEPVLWSGSLGALYARYRALLAVKQ